MAIEFASWFPLFRTVMENETFINNLSPADKLFYWELINTYNLNMGEFYRSDLEFAVILGVSEKTIQRARKKFLNTNWIEVKPGFRTGGKNLATRYIGVKYSRIQEKTEEQGEFFAPMHRHTFRVLLARTSGVLSKQFKHSDLVVYCYLWYLWHKFGQNNDFFATLETLRQLTGIYDVESCLGRLYHNFEFYSGDHLFEYSIANNKIMFSKWSWFTDPEKDESARERSLEITQRIEEKVKNEKISRQKYQELHSIIPENPTDIISFFKEVTKRATGYRETIGRNQKEYLIRLAETYGTKPLARAIISFARESDWITCSNFLEWFERQAI